MTGDAADTGTDATAARAGALARLTAILPDLERLAEKADAKGVIERAAWTLLREAGVLAAALPVAQGGAGLSAPAAAGDLCTLLRQLGGADLSVARLSEGHVNAIALVERYGTPAQRDDLAAAVRDGALSAVWGADDARRLTATPERGGYRLAGRKVFASGAGFVVRPLVTAATPEGPLLLMLRLGPDERADTSGWTPLGMRASATGTVDLDGVFVPQEAVIGGPGDMLRQPHFSGGAWRFCAVHLGAAERLTDLFRAQLLARGRAEDPYQLQRVTTCVSAVGSARFWVEAAAHRLAADGDPVEAVAFANLTRVVVERAALDVLEAVQRGIGLPGFLRPNPIERIGRDLATYLRQPVPDLAMADAARVVLASPRPTGALWDAP